MLRRSLTLTLTLASAITLPTAQATNGLFLIGAGNISRGMGGVSIAYPVDSLSTYANPASIAGMKRRFDIGGDIFVPIAEGTLGSVSAESKNNGIGIDNVYLMPSMGAVFPGEMLGLSNRFTLGLAAVPVGGGGTRYETNFYQAAAAGTTDTPKINDTLGVNLVTMQINPTLAYQVNEKHSIGFTLVTSIARFRAYGLDLFDPFTQDSGTLTDFSNQGNDWTGGAGIRLGWLGNFGDLKLGASVSSRIYMDNFNRYEQLFAEDGDLDTPPIVGIGVSFKATPKVNIGLDINHIFYEDVRAINNPGPNLAGNPSGSLDPETQQLGMKNGLGFGWSDQTALKIGTEYLYSDKLTLRTGWNYAKSPIDEDREIIFNLLAPAATQNHFTLGGSYRFSPGKELNISFVHALEFEQSGPTYVSDDGSNRGSLKMFQNSLGVSYSVKF